MDLLNNIRSTLMERSQTESIYKDLCDEFEEDYANVKREVRKKLMKKIIEQELKKGNYGGMLQEMYGVVKSSAPTQAPYPDGCFITISFDDDKVDPSKIPEYMEKVTKKKWLTEWEYVIEQRGSEPNKYYGYHVHLLARTKKRKSEIVREIYNTLKSYVTAQNYIDVRKVKNVEGVQSYMSGDKEESKMSKVENDKPFRTKYGLQCIYKKVPQPLGELLKVEGGQT